MALNLTDLTARAGRDAGLLVLGAIDTASMTDIITDAVSAYCRESDSPIISAVMAVNSGSYGPYTIPSTIKKLKDIRNTAGKSAAMFFDPVVSEVVFVSAPAADGNYTVYGTPDNVKTNLEAVIVAISENDESLLMNFVRAYALLWAKEETGLPELGNAISLVKQARRRANRTLFCDGMSLQARDERGYTTGDSGNALGLPVDNDDNLSNRLR